MSRSLRSVAGRARRIIGRREAAADNYKVSVTLRHTSRRAHVSGSLRANHVVEGLVGVRPHGLGDPILVLEQDSDNNFDFTIDAPVLYDRMGRTDGQIDLFLEVRAGRDAELQRIRLGNFVRTDRESAVDPVDCGDARAWFHITGKGNVSLYFGREALKRTKLTTTRLVSRADAVEFEAQLETYSRPVESAVGTWVGRQSGQRHEFPVRCERRRDTAANASGLFAYAVSGRFSPTMLARYDQLDANYDLHVEVRLRGIEQSVRKGLRQVAHQSPRRIREVVVDHGADTDVYIPYFTFRNKRLSFLGESFASVDFHYMQRLRWVSWMFFAIRPFLKIWLIGETPYKAQDNGFHFFAWLRRTHPHRRAYYVLEADSPDFAKVAAYGNVLPRFSRKHILYTLLASRFVGSHHAEYLFASRIASMVRRSGGLRVFLQHGVTAAKNVTLNYGRRHMFEMPADRFVVNSDVERNIVIQDLDFLPSQVKVTGFARFDELFAADVDVEPTILVMPTWRDWLMREESFVGSDYHTMWEGFLRHPRLGELMDRHGVSVEFILHPNMRHYASHFDAPGVTMRHLGDEDLQQMIKRSSVLVTDYSSVAWDFSFLDRPVHYFQFDQTRFMGDRLPYIDFTTQLPGKIARSTEELLADLQETLVNQMAIPEEYAKRSRLFLARRDRHNCERTFAMIDKAAGPRTVLTRLRNSRRSRNFYTRFRASQRYHSVMTWVYRLAKLLPRRDLIVFESDRGLKYSDSPRYLYERLLERSDLHQLAYVNNTTLRLPDLDTIKIRRLSAKYYWLMGRARMWVFNQNAAEQFKPGARTHFVQTWHGTPLKKMQNDVTQMQGRKDDYHRQATRLVSYWDTLISPSPYATAAFRSAFGFEGKIVESGYPRNDIFSAPDRAERQATVRAKLGVAEGKRIILYAPTFRDDLRRGQHWTADMALDLAAMRLAVGDDHVVCVRFHNLVRRKVDAQDALDGFVFDVSNYPDIQELLLATDILITDYSSLMFDYACLQRPMLFFTYDLEHYRDDLRGFYFDFEAEAPGPLLFNSADVINAVADIETVAAQYREQLAVFAQRFGPTEDGHASDRVLDAILGP